MKRSCANCRRHRNVNGGLRCDERRSTAAGDVIVLDVVYSKMAGSFERICSVVATRCRSFVANT